MRIQRKFLLLLGLTIVYSGSYGQDLSPRDMVQASIDSLFHAMRVQDTSLARSLFMSDASLTSISLDQSRSTQKNTGEIEKFIQGMGRAREAVWDEKIWSYDIKIDYPLAVAWTDYTFYLGDNISHCGVNVFELMNIEGKWLISGITDTRRKIGCITKSKSDVNLLMDQWHHAATVADEDVFFRSMTNDGIYIGTDAAERWVSHEMEEWAQPYFDRDTAWAFTPIERNISFNREETIGWFDELLETWMGQCRGSGIVVKTSQGWKIKHYHLAIAVPNDVVDGYLDLIGKPRKKSSE